MSSEEQPTPQQREYRDNVSKYGLTKANLLLLGTKLLTHRYIIVAIALGSMEKIRKLEWAVADSPDVVPALCIIPFPSGKLFDRGTCLVLTKFGPENERAFNWLVEHDHFPVQLTS